MTPAELLELMRSRRVTRAFTDEPIGDEDLRSVLEAGRLASSAGNRSIVRFLVVREPRTIELVRALSPGMLGRPTALVVICTDLERARVEEVGVEADTTIHMDVGTAAMNMMLAAHAAGLGSCPTTSYSHAGVRAALELPDHAVPEFILQLGHKAPPPSRRARGRAKPRLDEIVFRERYGVREGAGG